MLSLSLCWCEEPPPERAFVLSPSRPNTSLPSQYRQWQISPSPLSPLPRIQAKCVRIDSWQDHRGRFETPASPVYRPIGYLEGIVLLSSGLGLRLGSGKVLLRLGLGLGLGIQKWELNWQQYDGRGEGAVMTDSPKYRNITVLTWRFILPLRDKLQRTHQ